MKLICDQSCRDFDLSQKAATLLDTPIAPVLGLLHIFCKLGNSSNAKKLGIFFWEVQHACHCVVVQWPLTIFGFLLLYGSAVPLRSMTRFIEVNRAKLIFSFRRRSKQRKSNYHFRLAAILWHPQCPHILYAIVAAVSRRTAKMFKPPARHLKCSKVLQNVLQSAYIRVLQGQSSPWSFHSECYIFNQNSSEYSNSRVICKQK